MRASRGAPATIAGCAVIAAAAILIAAPDGDRAGAQSGITVSAGQLLINQRISQASVRRSNRALNYLAPIRTAGSDAADDGTGGVVPPAGGGWTSEHLAAGAVGASEIAPAAVGTGHLADQAVTSPKLADGVVGPAKLSPDVDARFALWAVVSPAGALVRGRGATTVSVIAATYFYRVDFNRPVRDCSFTATIGSPGQAYVGAGEISTFGHPVAPQAVVVVTHRSDGFGEARGFHLTVNC